jgi:predicted DNA-binding mobile mystery protein A
MNKRAAQSIRLNQLNEQLQPGQPVRSLQRPLAGWLKAVRQALGLSLKAVAGRLKLSPQAIHQLEKSEAAGTISLRQLEVLAGAMGCRLVYTLVPLQGTMADLAKNESDKASRAVSHTMLLEGQEDGAGPGTTKPAS